jgi:hypothetical protein
VPGNVGVVHIAGRDVVVRLLGKREYLEAYLTAWGAPTLLDRVLIALTGVPHARAFFNSWKGIWAYEGAWDLEGLLAHEFGHARGLDHPVGLRWAVWAVANGFPTMGPLLRLRDPEGLRRLARSYLLQHWRDSP